MSISLAFAGSGIVQCQGVSCSWQDFANTLANLLSTLVMISFWIAVLLSVIGAFLMMFHGPKPDLYQKGWGMIKIAILGYISILLAGILFDAVLEFFTPEFKTSRILNFSLAADLTPKTYFDPFKNQLTQGLKCGQSATKTIDRLIGCIGEAIGALSGLAVILLGVAIFASAAYLISTPLFGLGNIPKAWQILIWSTIGLIIVLLASIIADQVKNLLNSHQIQFLPNFLLADIKPGDVQFSYVTKTVRVCPPSIFGATHTNDVCQYPDIESIVRTIVDFIIQRLAPPLLVFLIIIGGFFYLLSPFDVKNIQTGHRYIQWAVYGYVVLLVVTAILSVINVFFGGPSANP